MDIQQAASRRFETHINFTPEQADVPRISQDIVNFLGEHGEAGLLIPRVFHYALTSSPTTDIGTESLQMRFSSDQLYELKSTTALSLCKIISFRARFMSNRLRAIDVLLLP